jgi:hypothetical protein
MQLCAEAGAVVITGTGVGVGEFIMTGGFPVVHPLAIIRPAVISRRTNSKPEVFPAIFFVCHGKHDNYFGESDSDFIDMLSFW